MNKEEIKAVHIRLDAGRENTILSILLAADGSINRMGNGRLGDIDAEKVLNIGAGQEQVFRAFISRMPDDMLQYAERYDLPEPRGLPCKLTLLFAGPDDSGVGFEFNYGSESQGPPAEIQELLLAAVEITDGWLRTQKSKTQKSWWKPW
jgi:hypothetical protein